MAKKRPCIIAGNWKMNKTIDEGLSFIEELSPKIEETDLLVYLAVPFTSIQACAEKAKDGPILVGAQNMNDASNGAFTGEIAASMLLNAGARFVILGHSERRHLFGETDEFIQRKVIKALENGLQPIVCVGETKEERENGEEKEVVTNQLTQSLAGIDKKTMKTVIVAYEPVWAIGTNLSASIEDIQEMHAHCRNCIQEEWGKRAASAIPILYGGSVSKENAAPIIEQVDVDGVLVGGASLSTDNFGEIIQRINRIHEVAL